MKSALFYLLFILPLQAALLTSPKENESIVFIGNGLAERMLDHPYLETELQLRFPKQKLTLRNMARMGDTASFRPHPSRKTQWAFPGAQKFRREYRAHSGQGHHPTPDQWLTTLKADTIIAFFGYNESFDGEARLKAFKGEINAFITHTLAQKYNGTSPPNLVLVSPIAFENLSATRDLPDGEKENQRLALYTQALKEICTKRNIPFLDLFTPTQKILASGTSLTRNGFLPHDKGYQILAPTIADSLYGKTTPPNTHRHLVQKSIAEKNWFWFNDYRMLNGVHVDGRRHAPYGNVNYPDEIEKIREMTILRDHAIWRALEGKTSDLSQADKEQTRTLANTETNYTPSKKNGTPDYLDHHKAIENFTLPEGYKIELFASEKDFPNLANPVQLAFDNKGRLWVSTMPSYPHYKPGETLPNDKILIYEDTNNDGKADKETVFADGLHLPTGFEISHNGIYVSQEPHLMLFRDTDGDDKCDTREIILTGFCTHDTHHAIGAFCADPSGAIMMCEGVFHHTGVETPRGPVRGIDGGFYRYSPQREDLERTQMHIPNPWGFAFDDWGQDFFIHSSGTKFNWHMPSSLKTPYGAKNPLTKDLAPKGNQVRPTSGLEFMSSRHFPDHVQGDIMLANTIGFLGIKQHKISDDGTGYQTAHQQDLVTSSDRNFRPVDFEIAPDGSLFLVDWHNALIGHMQHSARDPLRDKIHGRIYRITYPSRPLLEPAKIHGASITQLLENLKLHEYRTRYRTRRELRSRDKDQVLPAIQKWIAALDQTDEKYEHHLLEALWVTWGLNATDETLLKKLLKAQDHRTRAAAVRVLRYNTHLIKNHPALLKLAASDPHGRVRLEAIAASSWLPNPAHGKAIVKTAQTKPTDEWLESPLKTAAQRLAGAPEVEIDENPAPTPPAHLTADEKKLFLLGHHIYHLDGHCATCHQADGEGLPAAGFPPIANTAWTTGNEDRLIKLALNGLHGPIVVRGVQYPGHVPMTAFGGILDDQKMAGVLTFVRNHFGNKASPITPAKVKEIREATKGKISFYSPEELLKTHPLEK